MKMKNYFFGETKQNELMSKKHEKATLDYIEQLYYTITGFI